MGFRRMTRRLAPVLVVALAAVLAASGTFGHHDDFGPPGSTTRVAAGDEPFFPHAAHPCSACTAAATASALPALDAAVPLVDAVLLDADRPAKALAARRSLRRGRSPPTA